VLLRSQGARRLLVTGELQHEPRTLVLRFRGKVTGGFNGTVERDTFFGMAKEAKMGRLSVPAGLGLAGAGSDWPPAFT